MGRVSRYKKISKDDPFAPRRAKEVDETIDYAPEPTKEVDDAGGMTRTAKAVMKAQERMRRDQEQKRFDALSEKAKQRAVNKPSFDFVSVAQKSASLEHAEGQYKPNMQPKFEARQSDETYHEFTARLRSETKERNSKRISMDTRKQEKRKEYYERKREQKRRRQQGVDSEDELDEQEGRIGDFSKLVDPSKPKFGEHAPPPPKFSVLPKHATKVDATIAKRVQAAGITSSSPIVAFKEKKKMAVAKLADIDPQYASTIGAASALPESSQRGSNQSEMEALRQRVQEQYRKLKEQRLNEKKNATSSFRPIDKSLNRKKKVHSLNFSEEDMERFQEMRPESKASMKKARKDSRWLRGGRR